MRFLAQHPFKSRLQAAFALIMVLWTIAFLGGVILLVIGSVNHWLDQETYAERAFRARQLALTGLAIGQNPEIDADDPVLTKGKPDSKEGESYQVIISNETGRINPNIFLASHDNTLFQRLFSHWGASEDQIEAAFDGLFDWQSPTEFPSPHGAKRSQYEAIGLKGYPPNAPFTDTKEMEMVLGFGPIMQLKPDWQDYFSTYNLGKININACGSEILTDLLGLTPEQAEGFLKLRDGTPGDPNFQNNSNNNLAPIQTIDQAKAVLGANKEQSAILDNYFVTQGNTRRIESVGRCQQTEHHIILIVQNGLTAKILSWQEE